MCKWILALVILSSASTRAATVSVTIRPGQSVKLKAPQGTEMKSQDVFGAKIHYSRFPNGGKGLHERRKRVFLSLFVEEIDPYTGRKLERQKCLGKSEDLGVWFKSGSGANWSACQSEASDIKSVRLWQYCAGDLWEVTIQHLTSFDQKIRVQCEGV